MPNIRVRLCFKALTLKKIFQMVNCQTQNDNVIFGGMHKRDGRFFFSFCKGFNTVIN